MNEAPHQTIMSTNAPKSCYREQSPFLTGAWAEHRLFHPRVTCVHEGWNEHNHPYVYRRRYPDGKPFAPERAGKRVLSASREERLRGFGKVWCILRYFYPYFDAVGPDPERTLQAWIPKIEAAEGLEEYYAVLERFLATLNDSHAQLVAQFDRQPGSLPVTFAWIEGNVVIAGTALERGVEPGDNVLAMKGVSPHALREEWQSRISASSPQAFTRDFLWRLRQGPLGEPVELTVRNARGRRTVLLTYAGAETPPPELERTPPQFSGYAWLRGAAYIRKLGGNLALMRPFDMPDAQTLRSAFSLVADTCGLVLDLRGYPNTHFQHELVRCLCNEPVISPRYEIPVVSDPDLSKRTWKLVQHTLEPDGRPVYSRPVVVLIDETTQSSAEDFCMYLRNARRVTFVGRPTAGCVGNLTTIDLPGGGWASFTGMRVTWPDGSPMWGAGIQPDVIVKPTLEGLRVGRDEVLEKRIEFLKSTTFIEDV